MYGNYFYYNGQTSQDYGLMIGGYNLDTDVPLGMSREILRGSMNRYRITPNHMGTAYQEPLVFTISMVKDQCSSADEYVFTEDEVDAIVSWLTEPQYPTLFHMYDEEPDVYKKYDYFGLFSDIQTITNNEEVIGFTMTFTTNAPYAWEPEKTISYSSSTTGSTTLTIPVNTSERGLPIWPTITITPNIDATTVGTRVPVTIRSEEDDRQMDLKLTKLRHVIDCRRAMITGPNGLIHFTDLGISDVGDMYWLRLYNGNNRITISGEAEITISFREPRKVGAY